MRIRAAEKSDAHAMARIYVRTWRDTYLSLIPYGYLHEMSIPLHEKAFCEELAGGRVLGFVAETGGRVVGFATGGAARNGNAVYGGEIFTLYVLKSFQRQGAGARLAAALAKQFNHEGIYAMLVQVLKDNPYRRFYKKLNAVLLKSERLPFAGEVLDVETYGWIDTSLIYDQTFKVGP
jgi:GNAT superfamily N-acetyltransferase